LDREVKKWGFDCEDELLRKLQKKTALVKRVKKSTPSAAGGSCRQMGWRALENQSHCHVEEAKDLRQAKETSVREKWGPLSAKKNQNNEDQADAILVRSLRTVPEGGALILSKGP